ncbi:GNAT family N-acetyltransferase [Phaeodactylibacter luteus]|nr:GNAT family N-acetyltransferase [Phaeodactylibacter luteus]
MFAEKHYPEILLPEELDAYLSKGWYRMGQTMFTTHFLCFGRSFYSAIWVRLGLQGYRFRKSLRKLVRKNDALFTAQVRPASITPEKERLYRRYKSAFSGLLAPTLHDALMDGEDHNIFQTLEVAVYHGNRLIGLSYFDTGAESAASIMGVYDPDYSKHSVGFYTMLKEIEHAKAAGLQYFYPGYVVPGYPRFDYKLRIGEADYFELGTQSWKPYKALRETDIPMLQMEQHLSDMQQYLAHFGIAAQVMYYPLFEANLFGFWNAPYVDHPIFLKVERAAADERVWMVLYEPGLKKYQLTVAAPFNDLQLYFNNSYTASFDKRHNYVELLVVESILETSSKPEAIRQALGQMATRP